MTFLTPRRSWILYALLIGGNWTSVGFAQTLAPAQPLSFAQARAMLQTQSPQLAASRKAVESAQLRREGMDGLGGPTVAVSGTVYRYAVDQHLNLEPARSAITNAIGSHLPGLGPLPPGLGLPSNYHLQRKDTNSSASLSALWPVYVGGLSDAVREGLDGQAQEAQADASTTASQLHSVLVQRYFSAQLAARAARLRQRALAGVQAHDAAAERMLQAGVIARVERLQASAALAQAQQAARQAEHDAQLAYSALARTVQSPARVLPATPLFVLLQPLPPLEQFQAAALQFHPGLEKVAAKRSQAQALHDASEAARKPQVLAFGAREVNTQGKPNWAAGMTVRWTLWDSVDRDKLAAAGQRAIEQAELTDAQVRSDIALLVEKNWLAVEQARTDYVAGQAQETLAHELLRLRTAGLREGTSTTLEVVDAELQLAKVQTERAATANAYVQALAALLESTGQPETFEHYLSRADVWITTDAP